MLGLGVLRKPNLPKMPKKPQKDIFQGKVEGGRRKNPGLDIANERIDTLEMTVKDLLSAVRVFHTIAKNAIDEA